MSSHRKRNGQLREQREREERQRREARLAARDTMRQLRVPNAMPGGFRPGTRRWPR